MQKYTISLCMIVKDEEKYIERCLKSVQGKVDEIIVVDTGSTDSTVEIAKKHNAVIKHFDWIDDFAAARNYSIKDVESDYIIVLDADEYLDDNVDLQNLLMQNKDFYKLVVKNYQSNGKSVFHQIVRIFKSGIGIEYSGKLHESLNVYNEDLNYSGTEADIVIHHVGYLSEVVKEKNKKKRNYDIMIRELQDNPTGYSYYNMGLTYMADENYNKAIEMLIKSYSMSKDKAYVKGLLVRMGECLNILNRTEEAIGLLADAVNAFPGYTDLHYSLGLLFKECGYMKDAETEFKKCLSLGDKVDNITIEGVGSFMANYQLALVYESEGRNDEAFDESYNAIMKKKSYTPALSLYIKLMQRAGIAADRIKEHLNKVYKIKTVEDLKSLIYSLYDIRSPLLSKYEFAFREGQSAEVIAIAAMLNKQYGKALKEWERVGLIANAYIIDATVMCLISKDRTLLDKLRVSQNFSSKEWKTISRILLNENNEKLYLTSEVEKYLLRISEYLMNSDEFEQFEYISRFLLQCSVRIQESLAAILLDYGHFDTAVELLNIIMELYPKRFECNVLMGEAYMKQGKQAEALEYFERGLSIKQNYSTHEKVYRLYEKMGSKRKLKDLSVIMKEKYPLSIWLKTEVNYEQ